jgi:hypothetical protein
MCQNAARTPLLAVMVPSPTRCSSITQSCRPVLGAWSLPHIVSASGPVNAFGFAGFIFISNNDTLNFGVARPE